MGEIKKFDEDECVKFIRGTLSDEKNAELSLPEGLIEM